MENEFYFIAEDHTKPPAQKGGGDAVESQYSTEGANPKHDKPSLH